MNLTSSSLTLASARLTSPRECIVAGVTPGLQNLRQYKGLREVAGRELATKSGEARGSGQGDGGGGPDQNGAGEDPLRSNSRSSGPLSGKPVQIDPKRAPRFWSRVDFNGPGGCWMWRGAKKGGSGYANFRCGDRVVSGHRISWVLVNGQVPDGMVLDHLCRNRACVNPKHLEAVTPRTNFARGAHPGAKASGSGMCMRGHSLATHAYARTTDGYLTCRECHRLRQASYRAAKRATA